ncbi:dUTP diphosphatase [Priestia aryabhattai]|uniref:dUTP diphosphatase n=1 Tax=Priestia aryabhattai TaxID=412384 RepID=UPI003D266FC5
MIDLKKHFEIQSGLMIHIEKNHPLQEGEDRESEKFLAAFVELGEGANDWRGFKFWSENPNSKPTLLEETVDFYHFLLELGIDSGYMPEWEELDFENVYKVKNITEQYLETFDALSMFRHEDDYEKYLDLLVCYFDLCKRLGFTEKMISDAYLKKNQINHYRQINGY